MAASVIAISSDSSDKSVGTSTARIILFGTIPTVISTLPHTSSFYTLIHLTPNGVRKMLKARKRVRPLPVGRLAYRYPPDHSSSDHFSSDDSSSYSPSYSLSGYSSDTSSGHSLPDSPFDTSAATFAGPSHKRCRSYTTSVPIARPIFRALSPVRADLLPPRKRIKGSVSTTDYEVSSYESYKPYTEPNIDSDVQTYIDACVAAVDAATAREMDFRIEVGIETERIDDIESRQREQEGRNLIVDGERSNLLERVVALEGSNTGLRDALCIERVRADSLQRRLGYVEEELRQNEDDNDNGSGGNGNHGNHNGDRDQNGGNGGARRNAPVARNEDDNDNGSGGNGNHGNHNRDRDQNGGNGGARRNAPVARVVRENGIDVSYQ
ncbi:hypothetical protein Tco_1292532 [Tanacetum coccineum]